MSMRSVRGLCRVKFYLHVARNYSLHHSLSLTAMSLTTSEMAIEDLVLAREE
jgi:hypothetical protein